MSEHSRRRRNDARARIADLLAETGDLDHPDVIDWLSSASADELRALLGDVLTRTNSARNPV